MAVKATGALPTHVNDFHSALATAIAGANCALGNYKKIAVKPFKVTGTVIAYASPDSTFAVTQELLNGATQSIHIGIYDFTAPFMKDILINAMRRGVEVQLMLDLSGKDEQRVFDELVELGCDGIQAPSCAHPFARFFSVVHQKVVVVDGLWTLVQSGNYSRNSIPPNGDGTGAGAGGGKFITGNRDCGVAIRHAGLAKFFAERLQGDRKLVLDEQAVTALAAAAGAGLALPGNQPLFAAAPTLLPKKLFPSKKFAVKNLVVRPVLTPDNYLADTIDLLKSARKSILIEQQYIRSQQPRVRELLEAIEHAQKQASGPLDVRIVLGKAFDQGDVAKADAMIKDLGQLLGLKRGKHIRFINQSRFVHCHNKLILVDGARALVSSQNFSQTAVFSNREAGVILEDAKITAYFTKIFESDFADGVTTPMKKKPKFFAPTAFATGKVVPIELGDIIEV